MAGDFAVSGPGGAVASGPTTQAPAKPQAAASGNATDFKAAVGDAIKTLQSAAAALAIPQVTKVSEQFIELVERSAKILEAQGKFKKPSDLSFLSKRVGELFNEMETVQKKDMKAPPNHIKTVLDGLPLFEWPFMAGDEVLIEHLKEIYSQL